MMEELKGTSAPHSLLLGAHCLQSKWHHKVVEKKFESLVYQQTAHDIKSGDQLGGKAIKLFP